MPFITKQKINSRLDNNNIEKVTTNNNLGNLSHELNSNDSMQTIDVGWDGWITSGILSEQIVVSDDLQIEKKQRLLRCISKQGWQKGGRGAHVQPPPQILAD